METGTSIAAKTGVSEITVSRFLRRIGFRGMAELKAEIGSPAAKLHIHAADRYMRLLEGELGTLLRRDADAILSLGAQISRNEWETAITAIDEADEVFVTGFQTVRGLAEDFARRLAIVRGSVRYVSAHDGGLVEWIPSIRRACEARALVLVDMVPYAREAETVVRTARGLGINVIVITDELNTWAQAHTPFASTPRPRRGHFWKAPALWQRSSIWSPMPSPVETPTKPDSGLQLGQRCCGILNSIDKAALSESGPLR
jgi:DNA-binding MurR/RpiR family transcriptional regulator